MSPVGENSATMRPLLRVWWVVTAAAAANPNCNCSISARSESMALRPGRRQGCYSKKVKESPDLFVWLGIGLGQKARISTILRFSTPCHCGLAPCFRDGAVPGQGQLCLDEPDQTYQGWVNPPVLSELRMFKPNHLLHLCISRRVDPLQASSGLSWSGWPLAPSSTRVDLDRNGNDLVSWSVSWSSPPSSHHW